jgi:nitrite reductase/ring-hydroxylating ferredoxin subunit
VRTGACETVANRDVATYPVRIEGDAIVVTLPDDPDAPPVPAP